MKRVCFLAILFAIAWSIPGLVRSAQTGTSMVYLLGDGNQRNVVFESFLNPG